MRIKWKNIIEIAREEAAKYYEQNKIPLTVRGLFYILVSKNIIPNTKTTYSSLSRALAITRYYGIFPWYYIIDKTRETTWGDLGHTLADAQRILEELKNLTPEKKDELLKEYLKRRYTITLSQWERQSHRVLVVVEKDAVYSIIKNIVKTQLGWDVSVTFTRGFESASSAKEIADWVKYLKRKEITPVLLLIYDFDPSGEYAAIDFIFRIIVLTLRKSEVEKYFKQWRTAKTDNEKKEILRDLTESTGIIWEKIMLTWDQVVKYNIPPTPEAEEVLKKLQRDPRKKWFKEKYGDLYQAEVDALLSLQPVESKNIIDNAIRKYFDQKIYEEVKKKEEELKKQIETLL